MMRRAPNKKSSGKYIVGALCVLLASVGFAYPYYSRMTSRNYMKHDGVLSPNQRQRGMFINPGVSDAGLDPAYDTKHEQSKAKKDAS